MCNVIQRDKDWEAQTHNSCAFIITFICHMTIQSSQHQKIIIITTEKIERNENKCRNNGLLFLLSLGCSQSAYSRHNKQLGIEGEGKTRSVFVFAWKTFLGQPLWILCQIVWSADHGGDARSFIPVRLRIKFR